MSDWFCSLTLWGKKRKKINLVTLPPRLYKTLTNCTAKYRTKRFAFQQRRGGGNMRWIQIPDTRGF